MGFEWLHTYKRTWQRQVENTKRSKKVEGDVDDNGPAEGVPAGGRGVAGVAALRALVNVRAGGHLRC